MNKRYPFDPSFKHHLLIAAGLTIWVFAFLFFTEPLDVGELTDKEKLLYLPVYGLFNSACYVLNLPFQYWWWRKQKQKWSLTAELLQIGLLTVTCFLVSRLVYYYIVMDAHPNAYTLGYFATHIYLPAIATILPIIAIGRWSFGKYKEKQLEDKKIEIQGAGSYEGLRLHLSDLICIQSADNYVEVAYLVQGEVKKQLIRNKLSEVEANRPELIRTHRSFLVNPTHFIQWKTGNRKLFMMLSSGLEVPVSKTYQQAVEVAVNSTTE